MIRHIPYVVYIAPEMPYKQEEIKPYNNEEEKGVQVEQMFDNIAHSYDKLNHRLSWNIDKLWRNKALKRLKPYSPQRMLDIATGTGDFAIQATKTLNPKELVGVDISEGMMEVGRKKIAQLGMDGVVSFKRDDCMNLSFEDESFDAVTAAFGIRNFGDLEKGLAEMLRVLKTGGHMCIVELTTPVRFPMRQLFKIYSHTVLPIYGRLISKDKTAYNYLTATIEAFPQGETMVKILKKIGYSKATFRRMTFGICTMYIAEK